MTLFDDLINSVQFEQARPIWQAQKSQEVLQPFFACLLAGMADDNYLLWIQKFVAHTKKQAAMSLATGHVDSALTAFWQLNRHKQLLQTLAQSSLLPIKTLQRVLPLAVHTGYQVLIDKAGDESLVFAVIIEHEKKIVSCLPSWADEVLGDKALDDDEMLAMMSVDSLVAESLKDMVLPEKVVVNDAPNITASHTNETVMADEVDNTPINPLYQTDVVNDHSLTARLAALLKPQGINPVLLGLSMVVIVLLAGVAYYYMTTNERAEQRAKIDVHASSVANVAKSLVVPMLSISVGSAGELYACHAELSNQALSDELMQLLQASFGETKCVIDINEDIQQAIPNVAKLKSVLALLKSAPYATFQLHGDVARINALNPGDTERLVADIGVLMEGVSVVSMSVVDLAAVVEESLDKAKQALDSLSDATTDVELAKAMSLQRFDATQGLVPEGNKAILAQSAALLHNRPQTRLIIAAHSDDVGDESVAQLQTQSLADAIKAELVANGALEEQLVAKGVGATFPFLDNQTPIGRFYNRRVEFLVYDESVVQALTHAQTTMLQDEFVPRLIEDTTDFPTYAVIDGQIVEQGNLSAFPSESTYLESQSQSPIYSVEDIEDLLNIGSEPATGSE